MKDKFFYILILVIILLAFFLGRSTIRPIHTTDRDTVSFYFSKESTIINTMTPILLQEIKASKDEIKRIKNSFDSLMFIIKNNYSDSIIQLPGFNLDTLLSREYKIDSSIYSIYDTLSVGLIMYPPEGIWNIKMKYAPTPVITRIDSIKLNEPQSIWRTLEYITIGTSIGILLAEFAK